MCGKVVSFLPSLFYCPAQLAAAYCTQRPSEQAVVTGIKPYPPPVHASIFIAHRVQYPHCLVHFRRVPEPFWKPDTTTTTKMTSAVSHQEPVLFHTNARHDFFSASEGNDYAGRGICSTSTRRHAASVMYNSLRLCTAVLPVLCITISTLPLLTSLALHLIIV